MEQEGVPGVAIVLVRDGRAVWAEEFGVTNVLTGKPVTPDATFKVASNSKVVTAYIALRLVDQMASFSMGTWPSRSPIAQIPYPNPPSGGGHIPNFLAILDTAVTSAAPIVGKRQATSIE